MTKRQSVCSRIRNARASLDNAEKSFRSNQEVRGELDLMLAEAELENLRQKRTGWVSWTRHTLALCLAVLLLSAGGLGWWWASAYGGNTTNAAARQVIPVKTEAGKVTGYTKPVIEKSLQQPVVSGGKGKSEAKMETGTVTPAHKTAGDTEIEKSGSISLSSAQMRQLIRSGKQELGNMGKIK